MAKQDIDFILLDESVVMHGFRALTSGAQLEAFKQNPVMLFMHGRAEAGYSKPLEDDVVLPIGKWYDIRIEGDKLLAKPEFDDDDDFAKRIEKKVVKKYLNAASVWIEPFAVSDEEGLKLAGQRGPTITKWGVLECSIVDIPNCRNALAIRNSAGKKIALTGNTESEEIITHLNSFIQNTHMDKKLMAVKLGLSENATDAEISAKFLSVLAEANKVTSIDAEVIKLKADKVELETKLSTMEKNVAAQKISDLVDGAITAKKLTATDRENYMKLAAADFETTKALIDGMKPFESLESKLGAGGADANNTELQELLKLSGRDLYLTGKLQRLKEVSLDHFKLKYKEYYGAEYKA